MIMGKASTAVPTCRRPERRIGTLHIVGSRITPIAVAKPIGTDDPGAVRIGCDEQASARLASRAEEEKR